MLLFQKRFHAGLVSGEVSLTFRRWPQPRVRVGGRYRCHPIGVLEVDALVQITAAEIGEPDAKKAGFASRAELLEYLASAAAAPFGPASPVYRVALHHGGDGDRVAIALDDELSAEDVADLRRRLDRLDAKGAWTARTFALIDRYPRIAASQLAKRVGRETEPFKIDVRKLKRLGLTQSFEVGYEISPRGRAFLAADRGKRARKVTAKAKTKPKAKRTR